MGLTYAIMELANNENIQVRKSTKKKRTTFATTDPITDTSNYSENFADQSKGRAQRNLR